MQVGEHKNKQRNHPRRASTAMGVSPLADTWTQGAAHHPSTWRGEEQSTRGDEVHSLKAVRPPLRSTRKSDCRQVTILAIQINTDSKFLWDVLLGYTKLWQRVPVLRICAPQQVSLEMQASLWRFLFLPFKSICDASSKPIQSTSHWNTI